LDEAVDIVLGNGLDNALSALDMHIGQGEVPDSVSPPPTQQDLSPHPPALHTHLVG